MRSQILASIAPSPGLRPYSSSMTEYEGSPLAAMSASGNFFPSDSGFESGGHSFTSSMASIATVISTSIGIDFWPYAADVPTDHLGIDESDIGILGKLCEKHQNQRLLTSHQANPNNYHGGNKVVSYNSKATNYSDGLSLDESSHHYSRPASSTMTTPTNGRRRSRAGTTRSLMSVAETAL